MTAPNATPPLEPSGIAQFVEHDRCPRYLKQRVEPGDEPNARDWREAFGVMNIALLGKGHEFEAEQLEWLAADAAHVIAPDLEDQTKAGVPDIPIDETWAATVSDRTAQLTAAIEHAATHPTPDDDTPYTLLYQAPLGGTLGEQPVYGDADCIAIAPADTTPHTNSDDTDIEAAVVARVIDCKSAHDEQPAHRVQVATYCALLEQTLAEGPSDIDCRIEASVLTQAQGSKNTPPQSPFALPTFRRSEWELFVTQLLAEDGPVDTALTSDLQALPFALDQVCNNCAYREACATRAVENPREPQSLALLGLDMSTQRTLQEVGLDSLHDVATLCAPQRETTPTAEPPQLPIDPPQKRTLEKALPMPIYELVLRAQALYGKIEPDYPEYRTPPAIPGNDWVPLPDDRCAGWGNLETAEPGELIHVSLFVRPEATIDRIGALGATVTADAYDEQITIGEVIEAVPDDPTIAATVEKRLLNRFLRELFGAIETVATALGDPEQAVIHGYTFSDHELEALIEALERHRDTLDRARALRALCSLHEDGHTDPDQSMVTAVQPILNEQFALQSPSQGLVSVVEQFDTTWTINSLDPLDGRPDSPLLREIFGEQFLSDAVPYLSADPDPGIRLHLARGPLAEGPTAEALDRPNATPDGWYRIRKRSGGQFPIEYLWAAVPKRPGEDTPRLHPESVDEWAVDEEHQPLYRQEIRRFYDRTDAATEAIQPDDVAYLAERLSKSLQRLVEAIPYKDAYQRKEPIDVTRLDQFELPVRTLPGAARDDLRMEYGAAREATIEHYRGSLRERARSGRSMPIRCTDYTLADDGTLRITAEFAYEALFADPNTAARVAQQARLRATEGTSGGSWRLLTPLKSTDPEAATAITAVAGQPRVEPAVDEPADTKHSPPVFVSELDGTTGTIVLTALPHRFRRYGSRFRVDHCGWQCPTGSNLTDPDTPPAEREGYVAGRWPVWIEPGERYCLDPMVDAFSAPKADRALRPETVTHNVGYHQLQATYSRGQPQPRPLEESIRAGVERFCAQLAASDACLTPNAAQQRFITALERPLVPLQGPPGTGKTSGAIAPALLARAYAHTRQDRPFTGLVVAPSHEAVDAVLAGVVGCLDDWRTDWTGLSELELLRVTPTPIPPDTPRADTTATQVAVTYAAYHSDAGAETIETLAPTPEEAPTPQLVFATPPTVYHILGLLAKATPAIEGTTAPAAMRYPPGLADVVCLDEASMLTIPQLLVATSALAPDGQTLLVGDHRQLATVSTVEWAETRRRPLTETGAYHSALAYVQQLAAATASDTLTTGAGTPTQSVLSQFGIDTTTEGPQ